MENANVRSVISHHVKTLVIINVKSVCKEIVMVCVTNVKDVWIYCVMETAIVSNAKEKAAMRNAFVKSVEFNIVMGYVTVINANNSILWQLIFIVLNRDFLKFTQWEALSFYIFRKQNIGSLFPIG